MKNVLSYIVVFLLIISTIACKSVSNYPIDSHAVVKIDTNLLGIWKAVEDTDKANYILIQSPYDVFMEIDRSFHRDSVKHYVEKQPLDAAHLKWDFQTAEANYYTAYDQFIAENNCHYYITYFNAHGQNPLYQQWDAYLSEIKKDFFLNIQYRFVSFTEDNIRVHAPPGELDEGYFFVRLIHISKDTLITAIVADSKLKDITSAKEVSKRIKENLGNPTFYSDTVHFYKVSGYHEDMSISVKKAN